MMYIEILKSTFVDLLTFIVLYNDVLYIYIEISLFEHLNYEMSILMIYKLLVEHEIYMYVFQPYTKYSS